MADEKRGVPRGRDGLFGLLFLLLGVVAGWSWWVTAPLWGTSTALVTLAVFVLAVVVKNRR